MEGRQEDRENGSISINVNRSGTIQNPRMVAKYVRVLVWWRDHVEEIVIRMGSGANVLILLSCLGRLCS